MQWLGKKYLFILGHSSCCINWSYKHIFIVHHMAYDGCYTLPRDIFGGKTLFWTINNSGSLNNTIKVKCASSILVNIIYDLDGCYTPIYVMLSGKFTFWSFENILNKSSFLSHTWHFLSLSIRDTNAWIQIILPLSYLRI